VIVLDLIDGRIAELDRLSATATLEGREPGGDGQGLDLLLVALRNLRQHMLAGASLPPRGDQVHVAPTESVSRARLE
jgi:hypothetical protein